MKRLFDFSVSLLLLICLLPFLLIFTILVCIKIGSPILFKQERPGLHEKSFFLYKFRTMTDARSSDGRLLPDSMRLTPFGKWLRKYSIDELPQLINVIKGDISLVGPRPLLIEYLPMYTEEQRKRHEVRPGITGWAQVNGRNTLTWEEKFDLDLWYVNHHTFFLDLKILFLTFLKVIKSEGINQAGQATVESFKGSNSGVREGHG